MHPATPESGSQADDALIARLRRLEDRQPPSSLLPQIMTRIARQRRVTPWQRIWQRLLQPATITFRPVPWAAGVAVALLLAATLVLRTGTAPLPPVPLAASNESPTAIVVTFALQAPEARSVQLIGSFNHWRPQARHVLTIDAQAGLWTIRLPLEPGRHEYAFLVDGVRVVADPQAVFSQLDGFGTRNSVIFADGLDVSRI